MQYKILEAADILLFKWDNSEEYYPVRCPSYPLLKWHGSYPKYCHGNCKYYKKTIENREVIFWCGKTVVGRTKHLNDFNFQINETESFGLTLSLLRKEVEVAHRFLTKIGIPTHDENGDELDLHERLLSMSINYKEWSAMMDATIEEMNRKEKEFIKDEDEEESLLEKISLLEAEVEQLKAHTWEQERAAIVAWLQDTIYDPTRDRLAERIEFGEHWPEGGEG